ncbi:MAG TPA: hypothetical protein PKA13_02495, partial [Geminicoccaceae bacterium]|nr:hypothetical protein [Geminicoccaceae bacterium]
MWVLFLYLFPPGGSGGGTPTTNVEAHQGVAAGRDLRDNTINIGIPPEQLPAIDPPTLSWPGPTRPSTAAREHGWMAGSAAGHDKEG